MIFEDAGYYDLTTMGLEIGDRKGRMTFSTKHAGVICGIEEVCRLFDGVSLPYERFREDGESVEAGTLLLACEGEAHLLHKVWKISQNILEYAGGIATYTANLLKKAREHNRNLVVSTTRKNFPGAKALMTKGVMCGGGAIHRLGLYDSVLVFKEHLVFLEKEEVEIHFKKLKQRWIEKKVTVEVDSHEEAHFFASLGADILQCEKMQIEELEKCVALKERFPSLLVGATGGVNLTNIDTYAKTGVDIIVTSSPYHAKPSDIKVVIEKL